MAGGELHAAGGHREEAAASRQAWHDRYGHGEGGITKPLLPKSAGCCSDAICEPGSICSSTCWQLVAAAMMMLLPMTAGMIGMIVEDGHH